MVVVGPVACGVGGALVNAPAALKSLYGSGGTHAATVKSQIGAGSARVQQVHTPPEITDAVAEFFGGAVVLDPCASPEHDYGALESWYGTQVPVTDRKGSPRYTKGGDPILKWIGPGRERPWEPGTYWNCPFVDLEEWIAHARAQLHVTYGEHVGLMPMRTHRVWFREYWDSCTRFCALNPVTFLGYDQAFPDRLMLSYHGERIEDFDRSFRHLGTCYTLSR